MNSAQGITEVVELELGTPLTERDVASDRRLIEASDTLICELDLEGRFVKANGPMTQVLGATPAELRQRSYLEFVHPEDRDSTETIAREMNARPGEVVAFRNRYVRHDGRVVWLAWQAMSDQAAGRVYALAQDVTARVQAEQAVVREHAAAAQAIADSESRLAEMSDHTPALVYIKDPEGRYLFVNRYYEAVMGRGAASCSGVHLKHNSDQEKLKTFFEFTANDDITLKSLEERIKTTPSELAKQKIQRKNQITALLDSISNSSVFVTQAFCDDVETLEKDVEAKKQATLDAAKVLAHNSKLQGIGEQTWKSMWLAAKRYSEEVAYNGIAYPNVAKDSVCVLCHQELSESAKARMTSFGDYIHGQLQSDLQKSENLYQQKLTSLPQFPNEESLNCKQI